ncbi:MAG: YDG domain-containing protein [Lachnospiraceae bacterium]|nr:YDG domain-containing protein [Lachnospiraceae bacterium]
MDEKKFFNRGFMRRVFALTLVAILFYTSTVTYISTLATNNDFSINNELNLELPDGEETGGEELGDENTDRGNTEENDSDDLTDIDENDEANEEDETGDIELTEEEIDAQLEILKQQLEEAHEAVLSAQENAVNALQEITARKSVFALVYLCEYYNVRQDASLDSGTVVRAYSGQTVEIRGIEFLDGEFWYRVSFYLLNDNVTAEQEITDADFTLYTGYIESSYLAYSDELLLEWEANYLIPWLEAVLHYENSLFELEMYLKEPEVIEEIEELEEELEFLEEFESFFAAAAFADFSFGDTGLMANSFADISATSISFSADIEQFPASYRPALYALKSKYPSWTFVRQNTIHNWATSVNGQVNPAHRSLIWDTAIPTWRGAWYEGRWHIATREAVEHIMDPRNNLTESWVFQFEQLTYNSSYHNLASMSNILQGTFMSGLIPGDSRTYAQAFMILGANNGISPYHLAGRVRQEHGTGGSALISGTYPGFLGLFNYFNIGASGSTTTQVITNGLTRARNEGWTTRYRSLEGGSTFIGNSYIKRGQDTLYLQKFNVSNGVYSHQYMQNVQAPRSEATTTFNSYQNSLHNAFVFKIPVYSGMPESAVPVNPNIRATSLSINNHAATLAIGNTLTLAATVLPNDTANKKVTWASSNESVATINRDTGVITPRAAGETTITATTADGSNLSRTTTVRVTDSLNTFTISTNNLTFNGVGSDTQTITANATSLGGINLAVAWRSSDTSVATVNSSGVVTPVGVGNAVITASVTMNGVVQAERTCTVNVVFVFVGDPINAEMPEITNLTEAKTLEQNYPATAISVSAGITDSGNLTYQWYRNTQDNNTGGSLISGATAASYTPPVTEAGTVYYYVIITNTIANNGDGGNKIASLSSNTVAVTVADTIAPTGTIMINNSTFTNFLNQITFGLFFNSSQTITITGADAGSGIDKIEWLVLNQEFENEAEARATGGWQIYDNANKPALPGDWKGAVYAKISDRAGNISVINSSGLVVYTDTLASEETIDYTKGTVGEASIMLNLNGNTIAAVHNGAAEVAGTNFVLDTSIDKMNGKLTFTQAYLESLPTNIPTVLTISYNPQGVIFQGTENKPASTTVTINISAAAQAPLSITNIPGAVTYMDTFTVGTIGGSGLGAVTYSSSNTDIAVVNSNTGAVSIVGTGTFTITATKAAHGIFDSRAASTAVTARAKTLSITGVTAFDRDFISGNSSVTLSGGTLIGVAATDSGDMAKLNFTLGNGQMADPNAGNDKAITTDIKLTGTLADNYVLTQPTLTVNIGKAALTIGEQPKIMQYTDTAVQTVDLAALVNPYNTGNKALSYEVGAYTGNDIITDGASVSNGSLLFTIKGGSPGDKAIIPVTVSGFMNYHDVTVNVAVTLTDKIPTTVTVAAPTIGLLYGTILGNPSAEAAAGGSTFTYLYSGVLANGNTFPASLAKPTEPGIYTVTAHLDSATHAGSATSTSFTIAGKNLSWSLGTVSEKIYDGGTAATVINQPVLNGIINDDNISIVTGSAVFSLANAGAGVSVTASGYGIAGSGDSWKYNAPSAQPNFANAAITAKPITIIDVSAVDRPFNGTTNVTLTGGTLIDVLAVDSGNPARLGFNLGNGTIATADSGNKNVTTNIILTGPAGANYSLTQPEGITVNISKANQNAPAFNLLFTPINETTYTVTIPVTTGAEYSFDGVNFSSTNILAGKVPGDTVTAYKRMAGTNNYYVSDKASASLTLPLFTAATPVASPNGSKFTGSQSITLSTASNGAKIYYTTNGSNPTAASTEYTGAFIVDNTTQVRAVAVKEGMLDSAVMTANFTKQVPGNENKAADAAPLPSPTPAAGQDQNDSPGNNSNNTSNQNANQTTAGGQTTVNGAAVINEQELTAEEDELEPIDTFIASAASENEPDAVSDDYLLENEITYITEDVTVSGDVRAASSGINRIPAIAALMAHDNFMQIILAGIATVMLICGAAVTIRIKNTKNNSKSRKHD